MKMINKQKIIVCFGCGSEDTELIRSTEHADTYRCRNCGRVFAKVRKNRVGDVSWSGK